MPHPPRCSFIALALAVLTGVAGADTTTLYLLNGTSVRGEIVARSAKNIDLKTASGVAKIKTARLMPVSRQQLKLPAEVEKDDDKPEVDAVLTQMEKLLAENAELKKQVEILKGQIQKMSPLAIEPKAPAEGPAAGR